MWSHRDAWVSASLCFSAQFPPKRSLLWILRLCLCVSSPRLLHSLLIPFSSQDRTGQEAKISNPFWSQSHHHHKCHRTYGVHCLQSLAGTWESPPPLGHPQEHPVVPPLALRHFCPPPKTSTAGLALLMLMGLGRLGRIFLPAAILPAGIETPWQSLELHNWKM